MSEFRGRLHGDEPISSRATDLLGRGRFVERIAHDVLHAPAGRGFVVSVMGEWGSGKTSVLRLVDETIGDEAVSLWFNPWLFSGTEELISRFFSEIAAQLEGYQDEEVSNIAGRVASYGKALAPLAQILVPGLGTVMHAGADAMAGAAEGKRVSTRERYNALADALAELSKRVVVYIDDIDRLRDDEIREVMRLVKLVGDLPNVVYVLAYDRPRVEQALGDDPQQGRAYIEKIVQLPHSVPPVRATQLYALDMWLVGEFPEVPFERYADDAILHCKSEQQARVVLDAIIERLAAVGLELNLDKTRIVYCKDSNRSGSHEHEQFTFLGYTFRPRRARNRSGELFVSFAPAVSDDAAKAIGRRIKRWRLHLWSGQTLADLAGAINQIVRGWIDFYGRFYRSKLISLLRRIDEYLVRWAMRKYKRLRGRPTRAWRFLATVARREPGLFAGLRG